MSLYQNTKNGQIVEFVGYHDKDFAMTKNANGSVSYVALADLVSYEPGKGRTGEVPESQTAEPEQDENKIPETAIPGKLQHARAPEAPCGYNEGSRA